MERIGRDSRSRIRAHLTRTIGKNTARALTGVGWELGVMGLAIHLTDPERAEAGRRGVRRSRRRAKRSWPGSSEGWGQASIRRWRGRRRRAFCGQGARPRSTQEKRPSHLDARVRCARCSRAAAHPWSCLQRESTLPASLPKSLGMSFAISQAAVSQHLKVLRDSGFATVRVDGARRIYAVDASPLKGIDAWLERFRHFWGAEAGCVGDRDRERQASTEKVMTKAGALADEGVYLIMPESGADFYKAMGCC